MNQDDNGYHDWMKFVHWTMRVDEFRSVEGKLCESIGWGNYAFGAFTCYHCIGHFTKAQLSQGVALSNNFEESPRLASIIPSTVAKRKHRLSPIAVNGSWYTNEPLIFVTVRRLGRPFVPITGGVFNGFIIALSRSSSNTNISFRCCSFFASMIQPESFFDAAIDPMHSCVYLKLKTSINS